MSSKLKVTDLLVEYCHMHSDKEHTILILQLLNFDTFFAVWRDNKTDELVMYRYLNGELREELKQNTLTSKKLMEELYLWAPISELNSLYSKSDIADFIEEYREDGYTEDITPGKWKIAKPLSEKEKKKIKADTKKKKKRRRIANVLEVTLIPLGCIGYFCPPLSGIAIVFIILAIVLMLIVNPSEE